MVHDVVSAKSLLTKHSSSFDNFAVCLVWLFFVFLSILESLLVQRYCIVQSCAVALRDFSRCISCLFCIVF